MTKILTSSEVAILIALGKARENPIGYEALRKIAGLTMRGFTIVWQRMEANRLLHYSYDNKREFTATFGGLSAVARHEINKARAARGSAPIELLDGNHRSLALKPEVL